tara:strand:+ start:214 stop:906 length:693 start_codon:yes stop_codon:yes gene_type:complete
MPIDPYKTLGLKNNATFLEIKTAYRNLVKTHHPDAGGDKKEIILLNAAWEILGDKEKRKVYDLNIKSKNSFIEKKRNVRNYAASKFEQSVKEKVAKEENALIFWMKNIYTPIDKLTGEIINTFPSKIKELSADPYDDLLMDSFCNFLTKSQKKINKIHELYQGISAPPSARELALSLYYCFSEVQDAIEELERYTQGYVDNYLHDGSEMIRDAKKKRLKLHQRRRELPKY